MTGSIAFLLSDQGEGIMGGLFVNKLTAPENLVLRLFKNNITPADGDDEGDYTEADFTGYSALTLTGASWTVTPGAPTVLSYAEQAFESSANQTAQLIYGAYLTQLSTGKSIGAGLLSDGPVSVTYNTDKIKVTPILNLKKAGE
jgi:hypothetical protein